MQTTVAIGAENMTLSPDASIKSIGFENNKKIQFLPMGVALSFPSLVVYSAANCSITTLLKRHFAGMATVQLMTLNNNSIETIGNDVLTDMTLLKWLNLGKFQSTFTLLSL